MPQEIGIDIRAARISINHIFRATTTRIRRCISIKRIAVEKIRSDDPKDRAYGFKHLSRVIDIQRRSYTRYVQNIQAVLTQIVPLNRLSSQLASLKPLESGYIARTRFNHNIRKLLERVTEIEHAFPSIVEKVNVLRSIIEKQHQLLKPNMSGEEEAELRRSIEVEEDESKVVIKELKDCMETTFKLLRGINLFQIRFLKYLKKCIKHKFSNLIDDAQVFCDKIEKYISAFYANKTLIQSVSFAVGFLASNETIKIIGLSVAGGIFGVDFLMDGIAGLPANRRYIRYWRARIKGIVDEEEQKAEERRMEFVGLAKAQMGMTEI